jgi:DNA-directed RNA polymerase specialized sigma24 family protein
MKAAALNKLFKNYADHPGHTELSDVLEGVRKYVISKYFRDTEKEGIAQVVVENVWRSIDPTCPAPLSAFDANKSSFSTWLSQCASRQRLNFNRNFAVEEVSATDEDLERFEFEGTDPWHSQGRSWTGALPPESFYYESPDPKCKIPLGKSAWERIGKINV